MSFSSLESIELIDGKIKEAEAAEVNLEESRRNLERDIRLKENQRIRINKLVT